MKQVNSKHIKEMIQEAASEYVWGVKNPTRAANQYKIKVLKQVIKEELEAALKESMGPYRVRELKTLLNEANEEGEVVIKHRYGGEAYEIYETWAHDEGVTITIREQDSSLKITEGEAPEEDKYEEIYGLATQAEEFARGVQDEELKASLMDVFTRIAVAAQEGQEGTF